MRLRLMHTLKKGLLGAGWLAALAAVLTLSNPPKSDAAGGPGVTVLNTPLPVTAAQSGPWNVSIANSPSVAIANSPTVLLAPGTSFRDADNPARQPWEVRQFVGLPAGYADASQTVQVPEGKRFVIEYVSGFGDIPIGQKLTVVSVYTFQPGVEFTTPHFFIPTFTGSYSGTVDQFVVSAQTRLYAQEGSNIFLQANRNGTGGNGNFTFSLSGHLVDMP